MHIIRDYDELGACYKGRELIALTLDGKKYFAERIMRGFFAYQVDSENKTKTEARVSRIQDGVMLKKIEEAYEKRSEALAQILAQNEELSFS